MEFENFNCRICNGKLIPKVNEIVCSNCKFLQHPIKEVDFEISPGSLKKKIDGKEDVLLIDVREKWEFSMSSIKNSKLIPIRELKDEFTNLDKNKQIVTICHFGNRSSNAARFLIQKGFNAKSLTGGIDAWAMKIDSSVKRY